MSGRTTSFSHHSRKRVKSVEKPRAMHLHLSDSLMERLVIQNDMEFCDEGYNGQDNEWI